LAAIPVAGALAYVVARDNDRVQTVLSDGWAALSAHSGAARAVGRALQVAVDRLGIVRPGIVGWSEAFGLALANWLWDAVCLVACIEALHLPVAWRGVLVIYGLTQISASLPITPGGIGVVEGSLAALLMAYGASSASAFAIVLLYRIVSFWGLVPMGWCAWFALELAERHGLRHRSHPWAIHTHAGGAEAPLSAGPERVMPPAPAPAARSPDRLMWGRSWKWPEAGAERPATRPTEASTC
jgi:putative heme transporter